MAALTPEEREIIARQRAGQPGAVPQVQGVGMDRAPSLDYRAPAGAPAQTPNARAPARSDIAAPTSYLDQARARQQMLIDRLHGIASGQVKSPAQELFEQQMQQTQNQSAGSSASLRDVGPGGQMQIAQQNDDVLAGQGVEQGAILKQQQMQQAEYALAQLYEQQRQGDLGLAGINSQNTLANRGLNDLYGINQAQNTYNADVRNAQQQADLARAKLGFSSADSASTGAKALAGVESGAAMFDYLRRAGAGSSQKPKPTLEDMNKPSYGWGGLGA